MEQCGTSSNFGLQMTIDGRTIDQYVKGARFGVNGAVGPVAADLNAHGGSVTMGIGAGARGSLGPSGSGSVAIPICKD